MKIVFVLPIDLHFFLQQFPLIKIDINDDRHTEMDRQTDRQTNITTHRHCSLELDEFLVQAGNHFKGAPPLELFALVTNSYVTLDVCYGSRHKELTYCDDCDDERLPRFSRMLVLFEARFISSSANECLHLPLKITQREQKKNKKIAQKWVTVLRQLKCTQV